MTTETEDVSASADDCQETNFGVVDTSGIQITLNSQNWGAGIRFQNVDVAQGTQIDSATLTMYGSTACSAGCATDIYGVAADDTSAWASGNKPSSQSKTTASVAFDSDGDFTPDMSYQTFTKDVTAIVQEILDRGGWASGNSMSFVIDCDTFGKNQAIFVATYDNVDVPPPNLEIVWTSIVTGKVHRLKLMGVGK